MSQDTSGRCGRPTAGESDSDVSMGTHVFRTVSSCFATLRQLRSIRRSTSQAVLLSLVVSLVLSRLDYGYATLAGLPGNHIDRLQSVMNSAARLVCSARKYEHITPLLRDLHWLRVPQRTEFKLSVLVFRCLHLTYLASELYVVWRTWIQERDCDLRRRLLFVTPSSCRTTSGDCAFFVAAPRAWNTLLSSVTASETLGTFKRRLKTHLFATSFP